MEERNMKNALRTAALAALVAVLVYASTTPPSGAVIEYHETALAGATVGQSSDVHYTPAQQFYLEGTGTTVITGLGVSVKDDWGTPTDDITLSVYTNGSGNVPQDLVTGSVKSFTPVVGQWNYIQYDSDVTLTNGSDNKYWIVATYPVQTENKGYYLYRSTSNTYAKGYFKCQKSSNPGVWDTYSYDLAFRVYADASLSVSGVSHACTVQDGVVALRWATASELGTLGFHVYRAETETGDPIRISQGLIEAKGTPSSGGEYTFMDRTVDHAGIYFYRITEVMAQGETALIGPLRVAVERTSGQPETCALEGAYPNPFNPGTTLLYRVGREAEGLPVRLTVYNVLGQAVRVLEDGANGVGSHSLAWDGRDDQGGALPGGVYFCRLWAGKTSRGAVKLLKVE